MNLQELTKSLIEFSTEIPPGNEEPCARFIVDYFNDLHVENAEVELDKFALGRANVVARFGPKKPGLLLGGHMDVVPVGDRSQWTHDPFGGELRSGKLYGRGSTDMKAGLAAAMKAVEEEAREGKLKKAGLIFVATAGEEAGFDGLESLLQRRVIGKGESRFGVLGEPTDMKPVRAHKGGATFRIIFKGVSSHASKPELGVNAVENCALFISELARLKSRLGKATDQDLGRSIITPTVLKGGTKSNVIPDQCELTLDARWIPKHNTNLIVKELTSVISGLRKKDANFRAKVETLYETLSLNIPMNHELVKLAESVSREKAQVAPYGTEAGLYLRHGIPTIVMGPGSLKQAHIIDEYIEVDEMEKARSIYSKMIGLVSR